MLFASSVLLAEQPCLSIKDLTSQHLDQMQQGTLNCILVVQEGDELPLHFELSGDTLAFNWFPPWEFFKGSLSAGVGTHVEPFGTIGLHADVR